MARKTDPLLTLPDKSGVLYVRLYQRMRALILQGAWPTGMRLPSSRRLAEDLGISRNTASLALEQLIADGWVETLSRAGTYVSAALPMSARPPHPTADSGARSPGRPPIPFEMSLGAVDAFPFEKWARLQNKVWTNFVPDLLYEGDPAGDPGLRQAIATIVAPTRGLAIGAEEVIVIGSTLSGLDLIAAALPAKSTVIVEDPGYHFADEAFHRRGWNVVPVPVDAEGLDVAAARARCLSPAVVVVGAASQFPYGVALSRSRRQQLIDWAKTSGAWIVDDSFDADARFDGNAPAAALAADDPDAPVITIYSLSRILFRSLRLGFMAVPPQLRPRLLDARAAMDGFEPLPNQLVLRDFVDRGLWSAHQRNCRALYQARRQALVAMLEPYLGILFDPALNTTGLHLVLKPLRHPADEVAEALRAAGIACTTLAEITRGIPGEEGILLGFAAFSPDVIEATRPALDQALSKFV